MTDNLALVAHAKEDVRVDVLPEPEPAADEAVVAIAYGGICGSDLHYWLHGAAGQSILREPMVLGHEIVGTLVFLSSDAAAFVNGQTIYVDGGMTAVV